MSFYDRCKAYLFAIYPGNPCYFSLKQSIKSDIKSGIDLNKHVTDIFVNNSDAAKVYEDEEEIYAALKEVVAATYMVLFDEQLVLGAKNLKDSIYDVLTEAAGIEMS